MTSDPLDILLAHDRWATGQIIAACVPLGDDPFHRMFEMGRGSLHDATTHILAAMGSWTDVLAGREQRPRIDQDGVRRTSAELLAILDQIGGDLAAAARSRPIDELVSRHREGKTYTFTRGGVITHVTTHGMHHRAQCLNMLRHLGVKPLPPSSVLEWMLMVDQKP
jgi:uncharacterized damage-inducible protein DinB